MKKKLLSLLLSFTIALSVPVYAENDARKEEIQAQIADLEAQIAELKKELSTLSGSDLSEAPSWSSGSYRVGEDIPAGEYVIFSKGFSGYIELCSDSSGSFDSIIMNDNIMSNSIVTIEDGQYFNMTSCTAYSINDVPELDTTKEGMFKVGLHLPAGEYNLVADSPFAYMEVSSSSTGKFEHILSNEVFDSNYIITVEDGQYLKLTGCHIK